jgi:DnaJ-domain-containing protein 1
MTDYFQLLDEPRRPWLDPERLKEKFLQLSAGAHPDRVHAASEAERSEAQRRSTELNAAYHCLREPASRLRHLLELELGAVPPDIQRVPPALMDLSMEIAGLCRQADSFLLEKDRATTALLKVQAFERGQEWTEKLQSLRQKVETLLDSETAALKNLDGQWNDAADHAGCLRRLEEICRLLKYFNRWQAQLQERIVRLAC